MKRKVLALLLTLAMVLTVLPGAAFAADNENSDVLTYADLAEISGDITIPDDASEATELTVADAVRALLLWTGMTEEQLGTFPADYLAQARSMGMITEDTDTDAACTLEAYRQMKAVADTMYAALHADKLQPLFMNGMAQPIFPYTTGSVESGYSNEDSNIIRYVVYVETNYDTDDDGKLDLVKAVVQIPRAAMEGDYKAATIYEARPYITGCNSSMNPGKNLGSESYDISKLYSQPAARTPVATATTEQAAAKADSADWYYYNPYEQMYDYEDLEWYDYYLTRGYAVVECGGLGTKGSDGFETCGSDLEIDAFKCVIEWLHGDRAAYTDKTSNIAITADWSNGKVGMTGRSYAGTTQFGLATTGVEGLETIVPVAGIASWYEYTNSQGISTNSAVNYTERLAWYCNGRYLDQTDYATIAEKYGNYLYQIQQDQLATNGDYSDHWKNRDYTLNAKNIKCPALIVHGLNDDNVRTKEFDLMYKAYQEAGVNVKLLLHQDAHLTPSYPAGNLEFYIDGESYNNVLNRWFSHYLYGVENGAENMAAVTAQDNADGSVWNTYDSWDTDEDVVLKDESKTGSTTINSDYAAQGINRNNWRDKLTAASTDVSAMYTMDVTADTVIKGSVAVNFTASADNYEADDAPRGGIDHDNAIAEDEELDGLDHDNFVAESNEGAVSVSVPDGADLLDRDALMVSAMLVDIAPEGETFHAFNTSGSYVKKDITEGAAWMGGGLANYDYAELVPSDVTYKIIARGWMDLCNPDAGYDSASAGNKVALKAGENHDYTLYLQPNLYTVKEGHKLALVIYTYEQGKARYTQNYQITLDNATVNAVIPVNEKTAEPEQKNPFTDVAEGSYCYDAILWAVNHEPQIANGVTATEFKPSNACTRGQIVTFLYRAAGEPDVSDVEVPFTDVPKDAYCYNAVKWAVSKGIAKGVTATTFKPNASATRGQAVTFLYRAAGEPDTADIAMPFTDVAAGSYCYNAVKWAYSKGVTNGTTATTFEPSKTCNRANIIAMLYRSQA